MSAFAALFFRDGRPVDDDALHRVGAAGEHLGPDGTHTLHLGRVGLVHCRLATGSTQPAAEVLVDGDLAVTADARIDNRRELCGELGLVDRPDTSDVFLILSAYRRFGEDCADHLLGDFSFALWDDRRRRLFCARDHIGIRPLVYHCGAHLAAVASSVDMLLALPEIPRALDDLAVGDFLNYHLEDTESTLFSAVRRLPPAHTLSIDEDGCRRRRYWLLDRRREIRLPSDEAYAEQFRDIFTAAVACRHRSGEDVGVIVSGGLDSSAVACVVRDQRWAAGEHDPLPAFTISADHLREADERTYIAAVLDSGGFNSTIMSARDLSPLASFPEQYLQTADPPTGRVNTYAFWEFFRTIRQRGVRVLLGGEDGDTVVGHGQGLMTEQARRLQWRALWRNAGSPMFTAGGAKPWQNVAMYGVAPYIPTGMRSRLLRRRPQAWERTSLLSAEFARRTGYADHFERWSPRRHLPLSERERHYRRLTAGILPIGFEGEKALAAHFGIERRYPFMDRRLVEYCLALPAEQKLRDGWTRYVFRRAMEGILPPEIQWRPNKGRFGMMLITNLLAHHRAELERFAGNAAVLEPYVDRSRLRDLYARFLAKPSPIDLLSVWTSYVMGRWLEESSFTPIGLPRPAAGPEVRV